MSRLSRLGWSLAALAVLVAGAAAFTSSGTMGSTGRDGAAAITVAQIAAQLGVKVLNGADESFETFTAFTGSLQEPEKLAAFGIKGMHPGARVAVVRISREFVQVEADELDPPQRAKVRLRIDASGNLVKP